jgi:hypothetical protein
MGEQEVRKRCVFFLGGYEPIPPDRQHERFIRELRRFEQTWNTTAKVSPLTRSANVGIWQVETQGRNWSVETEYRSLLWDDFVIADFARSNWVRVPRAVAAFADFILTGTAFRYFYFNWRYGLFFVYPILILASFVAAAIYAASLLAAAGLPLPYLLAPLAAFAIFVGLVVWPGQFLLLPYMLDDWLFAYEFVHRSRAGLEARLDSLAQDVATRLRQGGFDEFVFGGHSLGCAIKLDVLDRALRLIPDFGRNGETLNVVSTGSSLLKIALHPAGGPLREAIARVSAHPAIFWIEYQALADFISFYKVNPVAALKLPDTGKPVLRKLKIRHMLSEANARRFRYNLFRLHRQLVMGNEKRYFYDYLMICCGPFRLDTRARDADLMMTAFAPDGSLLAATKEKAPAS